MKKIYASAIIVISVICCVVIYRHFLRKSSFSDASFNPVSVGHSCAPNPDCKLHPESCLAMNLPPVCK